MQVKNMSKNLYSNAFTLAEVLITLAVIGIAAAMLLPSFFMNVAERVNSHREANIALKVTRAMEKMQVMGLLNRQYTSTDDFVDELQKHLKISKRCSAQNITECWPSKQVTTTDNEVYEVSNATTGDKLMHPYNNTDNVGLILADGAALILTYNQSATGTDETTPIIASKKTLPVGNGKTEEFVYTSSATANIDFVMDVNGGRGPNSETVNNKYHDIRSFKAARFGKGCIKAHDYNCIIDFGASYSPIDCSDSNSPNYEYCKPTPSGFTNDYWAGAKKACEDIGLKLPDYLSVPYNSTELPEKKYWSASQASKEVARYYDFENKYYDYGWHKLGQLNALCVDK